MKMIWWLLYMISWLCKCARFCTTEILPPSLNTFTSTLHLQDNGEDMDYKMSNQTKATIQRRAETSSTWHSSTPTLSEQTQRKRSHSDIVSLLDIIPTESNALRVERLPGSISLRNVFNGSATMNKHEQASFSKRPYSVPSTSLLSPKGPLVEVHAIEGTLRRVRSRSEPSIMKELEEFQFPRPKKQ